MAKVILTKEARLANRIIKSLPSNNEMAKINKISKQLQSYRVHQQYPKILIEAIELIHLAGFEIRERE